MKTFFLSVVAFFWAFSAWGQIESIQFSVSMKGPVYDPETHEYNPDYIRPKKYRLSLININSGKRRDIVNTLSMVIASNKPQTVIDRWEEQLDLYNLLCETDVLELVSLNSNWVYDPLIDREEFGSIIVPSPGKYRLKYRYYYLRNRKVESAIKTIEIELVDKLVVCLGESYMAGEGNPDIKLKSYCGLDAECENTLISRFTECSPVLKFLLNSFDPEYFLKKFSCNTIGRITGEDVTKNYPTWSEKHAHRSEKAGPALAAKLLSVSAYNKSVLVRFVSFARSGAKIDLGLIGPNVEYRIDTVNNQFHQWDEINNSCNSEVLEIERKIIAGKEMAIIKTSLVKDRWIGIGQIEEAKRSLKGQKIDALIVGIGGNDVQFPMNLENMVLEGFFFTGNTTSNETKSRDRVFANTIRLIEQLPGKFKALSQDLNKLNVSSDRIFLMEYPTALFEKMDSNGNAYDGYGCGVFTNWGWKSRNSIDRYDSALFRDLGSRLNGSISVACSEYGWNYIGGIQKAFAGHGYCSDDSYYVSMEDSCKEQGDFLGTAHPNGKGHNVYAQIISRRIKSKLEQDSPLEQNPSILILNPADSGRMP